jgi:hypothetical protein
MPDNPRNYLQNHAFGRHLLPITLILLTAVFCYSNSFLVPFVLDDVTSILLNPQTSSFAFSFKPRILGDLSFALNYKLHGFDLPGYHLTNLSLHLTNALLLYACVLTIFSTPVFTSLNTQKACRHLALAAAILFVAHPLQTAAVTYLAQRVTLMATLFYLLSVILYLKSRLSPNTLGSAALFILSLVSAAASLLSKENAATIPIAILLCEMTFFTGADRKRIFSPGLYLLPLLVALFLTNRAGIFQSDLPAALLNMTAESGAPPRFTYLLSQFPVILGYLRLFFLPIGQNLDHDVALRSSIADPVVIASFLALLFIMASALLLWRKGRKGEGFNNRFLLLAGFGIGWFFITICLESGVVPIRDLMFEQRVYLPSAGLVTAVTGISWFLFARWSSEGRGSRNFSVMILILTAALVVMTFSRNRVWRSEVTLWEDAVRKSPAKGRAYGALGHAYQREGRMAEAEKVYKDAVRLAPADYIARNNLGAIYLKQRRYADAAGEFKRAIELFPSTAAAHFNLGLADAALGSLVEAEASFSEAIRLKSDYREARENLAALKKIMAR